MASCTLYLEQYVESTTTLPAELQRILNTIKFLDEKSNSLREVVAQQTDALVAMPGPGQRSPEQEQVRVVCVCVSGRGRVEGMCADAAGGLLCVFW
jgi:hypothetical protein